MSISQPNFNFTDVTEHSITLRLQLSCVDQSLIERYDVSYLPKLGHGTVTNPTELSFDTVIPIDDLIIDTEYEVILTAYDEKGNIYVAKNLVRTKNKDNLIQRVLLLVLGLVILVIITNKVAKRVKKMINIKVELPSGLLGIDEVPVHIKFAHEEFEPMPEQPSEME